MNKLLFFIFILPMLFLIGCTSEDAGVNEGDIPRYRIDITNEFTDLPLVHSIAYTNSSVVYINDKLYDIEEDRYWNRWVIVDKFCTANNYWDLGLGRFKDLDEFDASDFRGCDEVKVYFAEEEHTYYEIYKDDLIHTQIKLNEKYFGDFVELRCEVCPNIIEVG